MTANQFKDLPQAQQDAFIHSLATDVCGMEDMGPTEELSIAWRNAIGKPAEFNPHTDLNHTMIVLRRLDGEQKKKHQTTVLKNTEWCGDIIYLVMVTTPQEHMEALWQMYQANELELESMEESKKCPKQVK